ncbi:MAG TPA: hypothetical protein VK210_10695 [Terriglobia bacterium]|nr:hypothetical protein [Terriglobia bacterium]
MAQIVAWFHSFCMLCMTSNPIKLAPNEAITHQIGPSKGRKQVCVRCGKVIDTPFGPWTEGVLLTEKVTDEWTEWKVERRKGDRGSAGPFSEFEG